MDNRRNVEDPAGQKDREELWEPEHQPGETDGKHSPEDSEKIEFLPVGPAVKGRPGTFVEKPADHSDDVLNIFPARAERIRAEKSLEKAGILSDLLKEEEIDDEGYGRSEIGKGDGRENAMNQTGNPGPS